jgi:hypothetical protein
MISGAADSQRLAAAIRTDSLAFTPKKANSSFEFFVCTKSLQVAIVAKTSPSGPPKNPSNLPISL